MVSAECKMEFDECYGSGLSDDSNDYGKLESHEY